MTRKPRKPPRTEETSTFIRYLESNLRETPPRRKGDRTRERLVIATARMLEKHGYHAMRVADITTCAGLAEGSFYVYFKDKKDASLKTLSTFIGEFVSAIAPPEAVYTPFRSIRAANRRWLALCRSNARLMRCIFQLADEDVDFARLIQKTSRGWYETASANIRQDRGRADADAVLLTVYFMCSMMDEIIRKVIVFPDREFLRLLKRWGADDMAIADAASVLWIRVFDPDAKLPDDLSPVAMDVAKMLWIE